MSQHPFDLLMELEPDQIRLDCAALHLARDVYPTINVNRYLDMLDAMAADAAALRPGLAANLRYDALRAVLADSYQLTGCEVDCHHPDNVYLNRVLDTGRGVPIGLSIVWIEVARRLKWSVSGVALPGHFVVRFDDPERFVLADPFHDGCTLSLSDCQRLVADVSDGKVALTTECLKPVDTRSILLRMLKTLRNAYLTANDLPRVASILRRMAAVEPANGRHLQDLAAICCRRGDVRGACAHLALYLQRSPDAPDSKLVWGNLRQLHAALLALN